MSDAPRKQEADFSKEYETLHPQCLELAKAGQLSQAIDKLAVLEKQSRNAADLSTTSKVLIAVTTLCWEAKELGKLNEQVLSFSKKHGQIRQAVVNMVDHVMTYLEQLQGTEKLDLIKTLREVTEGKIYLEVQRARVTRMLAHIKESEEGDITAASELLQDLQVETFGSMERREKVDFILEQMRLLRLRREWDKLNITSKIVNTKWISGSEHQDLKLRYYALMIQYALHESKYLDLCKYYRSVFDTPSIQEDEGKWKAALRNAVYFVILAPYDNEQSDLLARISKDDKLEKIGDCYNLVKCFTTPELMRWPGIQELYGPQLRQTKVFGPKGTPGIDPYDVEESDEDSQGDKRWEELHLRVVEHNVRTIAKYYSKIALTRLAELLDLSLKESEEVLARLAVSKMIYAKIDRPAGIVNFVVPKSVEQTLNDWSSDVGKLMGLIEKTCHLIAKEHAIANAKASASLVA